MASKLIKILFLLAIGIDVYLIAFHLHPALVDMAGHFGAAKIFSQGYFHSFDDTNFLGYIHNLFYPPLQDFLLSTIAYFVKQNFLLAGKIYLIISFSFFMFCTFKLLDIFQNQSTKIIFSICFTTFINSYSTMLGTQTFQGLNIYDQLITGLLSQFLGSGFLFLILRHLIIRSEKNIYTIAIFLACCILSHIVSFIVAILIIILFIIIEKCYKILKSIIIALSIGSIFLIPFILNSKYLTSAHIADINGFLMYALFVFSILCIYIYKNLYKKSWPLFFIFASIIFFINFLDSYIHYTYRIFVFPDFHYYRLCVYGIIFLFIDVSLLYDKLFFSNIDFKSKFSIILLYILICVSFFIAGFRLNIYYLNTNSNSLYHTMEVSISSKNIFNNSNFGRTMFVPNKFPGDQNLSEYLRLMGIQFNTANGVYWESALSNEIFVSYNSILFRNLGAVLNQWWVKIEECNEYNCFLDQFIREYNINTIVIDENLENNSLPKETKFCLMKVILEKQSNFFSFEKKGFFTTTDTITKEKKIYNVYNIRQKNIENKNTLFFNNKTIELINIKNYSQFDSKEKNFMQEYFIDTLNICQSPYSEKMNLTTYFNSQNINTFKSIVREYNQIDTFKENFEPEISFQKLEKNSYKITINTPHKVFFKIKFNYFPGMQLITTQGKPVPFIPGISYIVGYGNGEIILNYLKPWYFYFSYMVSAISFLYCVFKLFKK